MVKNLNKNMNVKKVQIIITAVFFISMNFGCAQNSNSKTNQDYTYKSGDPNGIGKWYMDREIAHVMGYQGIGWLERSEREEEESTSKLLANMNIENDDIIADIGAGSGYHVFKMAPMVPDGLIYAVDIQDEMLKALNQRKGQSKHKNIDIIKGSAKSINLPKRSVDKILMVDVYHEFNFPKEMLASMKLALRTGGQIYLIEYRSEDPNVPIKRLHKMTEKQAVNEMNAAGFVLDKNIGNLPWQHCMVFVVN